MRNKLMTKLFNKYYSVLYGFALKLTKNEVDAHDLVMELFVKLLEWPEGRIEFLIKMLEEDEFLENEKDRVLAYLGRILKNLFINRYRKLDSRNRNENFYAKKIKNNKSKSPEEIRISEEEYEMIFATMDDLFQKSDVAKAMSFYLKSEGYKIKEIALMLDIKENTVSTYIFRMRKELRSILRVAQ